MSYPIVVQARTVALVLSQSGSVFWIRFDGAIGRRRGDVMMWLAVEESEELIETETVPYDVYALDHAILRLAEILRDLRR